METEQNTTTETVVREETKHFGPLMGIFIIVALLVFGGLYFWGVSLQNTDTDTTAGTSPAPSSFEVLDTTIEEFTMTDEEFEALIGDGSVAGDTAEAVLDTTLDDLSDLDALDAELEALELEL